MGLKKMRLSASNAELRQAADLLTQIGAVFRRLAAAGDLLAVALEEVGRYRGEVKVSDAPLDWRGFVQSVALEDEGLAKALAGVRVTRFTLGHLTGCARDGQDYAFCQLNRERIEALLGDRFGARFRIRIRHQE